MAESTQAEQLWRKRRTGVLLGLLGWAVGVLLGVSGLSKFVDAPIYDAFARASDSIPQDERVGLVYVGDRDVALYRETQGRWPWTTRLPHATAAQVMYEAGALTVGYDIMFPEGADEDSDFELMESMAFFDAAVHGVLFQTAGGTRWSDVGLTDRALEALANEGATFGTDPDTTGLLEGHSPSMPIDLFLEGSEAMGHLNPTPDHDNAIRRVPLFVRNEGLLYPSLAFRMAMAALGVTHEQVTLDLEGREVRIEVAEGDVVRVPVDPDGTMWVHYDRPIEELEAILYSRLDDAAAAGKLTGRHVVIGVSVTGSRDAWRTPMGVQCPGFLIHGQILENVLTRRFMTAIQPDTYPTGSSELLVHVCVLLGCVLLGVIAASVEPRFGWSATLVLGAGPLVLGYVLLTRMDIWLTPATSTFALFGSGFLGVGYHQIMQARERRRIRGIYERYLSPQVLARVIDDPTLMQLGGARKELSVFFSDIRGFTSFSESVEPEELTERLNEYYTAMIDVVHAHEGTVDKLIGDSLMVFFGDPVPQEDHALRSVRMALDMRDRVEELTTEWIARGVHPFEVGIGIATGHVAVGNLGSEKFIDYTVVGQVVNLAARLQGGAKPREILVSDRVRELVDHEIETEPFGSREFKGITSEVEVFRVVGPR